MGNRDLRQIADKVADAAYADDFRREFGIGFDDAEKVAASVGSALEAYLFNPEMAPFSSKYDAYIRGQAKLTPIEARGLELFKDKERGGCDGCHKMNDHSPNPELSLFTDYSYDIVGAPRNRNLAANRNPQSYDLGLCERKDPRSHTDEERLCGAFRTPSLRNVATRASFMHNGVFNNLRDVIRFYATRTTSPERWYPAGATFDDLPVKYRDQVNVTSVPYNRRRGQAPLLNDADIDAIVSFLKTLTDSQYVIAD
jgi:cytochrome c peroxidase